MNSELVEYFCETPFLPITEYDTKVIAAADTIQIPFEGDSLPAFIWGEGKTILLVHGWGSRASHLALIGRFLVKSGFRVVAYDAPAHSSFNGHRQKTKSNMFEFCRAIFAVAKQIGPVYAIVGHSFGAATAVFNAAGFSKIAPYRISTEKMVLISSPASLESVIQHFGRHNGLDSAEVAELISGLEEEYNFSVREYQVDSALKKITADVLIIHDIEDEDIPVDDAYTLHKASPQSQIFLTEGAGHQRILVNRAMFAKVNEFLKQGDLV